MMMIGRFLQTLDLFTSFISAASKSHKVQQQRRAGLISIFAGLTFTVMENQSHHLIRFIICFQDFVSDGQL